MEFQSCVSHFVATYNGKKFVLKFLLWIRQLLFQYLETLFSPFLCSLFFSNVYFLAKILCQLKSQLLMSYQSTITHRCFLKYKFLDRYFSRIFHRHLDQVLKWSTFVQYDSESILLLMQYSRQKSYFDVTYFWGLIFLKFWILYSLISLLSISLQLLPLTIFVIHHYHVSLSTNYLDYICI